MAYTTIKKPSDYFNTSTWTATTSAISNLDFSPDWVWIKSTDSGNGHILFDTIRGANIRLSSAVDSGEFTVTDELMSFDSNGYTLGSSGNTNDTNPFNASYVGWSWRGSDSSAVSNTDGSITSTVSANTTSGFSIVSYTGTGANATVGHGLGVAPAMIIIKARTFIEEWIVYNQGMGNTDAINLNLTNASSSSVTYWQNTTPTSSFFYIGSNDKLNRSGDDYIAYCFAEKKGFSKFGSYTGNGSTDGTFVYTGFRPAFVMCKRTDSTGVWFMCDNKRVGFNGRPNNTATVGNPELSANDSRSEAAGNTNVMDIFSNGFKLIQSGLEINGSGASFIYMAFAEQPLVGDNPATAR